MKLKFWKKGKAKPAITYSTNKQRFTIDDLLLAACLVLTVAHSTHILSHYEIPEWGGMAWCLALGIDAGIARLAWVTSNRAANIGARIIAGIGLIFLLGGSFGLNTAYYAGQRAGDASPWLASFFPVMLATFAAVKSFLATRIEIKAEQPVPDTTTENLIEALRLQLHEAQDDIKRLQESAVTQEPVTLAGLVEMPELVSVGAGAADSGSVQPIDRSTQIVDNASIQSQTAEILRLLNHENLTQQQIADRLGISKRTVQNRLAQVKGINHEGKAEAS